MLHLDAGDHIEDITLNIELTRLGFDYVVSMMTIQIMHQQLIKSAQSICSNC